MPSIPLASPGYSNTGRHNPFFSHPDWKIYELNRRLQQRTEVNVQEGDNLWWDSFASEFFEDDATLTLSFCLEDGLKRYSIGRTLIPRYFRTIFDGGVTELYYHIVQPKESFHNGTSSITLDCENTTMVTHHIKPVFTKVCTEGRLMLEFGFDDMMRIRNWHFAIRTHCEMVPRNLLTRQDPTMLEQVSKNITRQGMTNVTLNYLRLCVILEPMQELMSRHKTYNMNPRDCLKSTLFQRWQRMIAPPEYSQPDLMGWQPNPAAPPAPEPTRAPRARRKRKSTTTPNTSNTSSSGGSSSKKKSQSPAAAPPSGAFSLATQDVMVVGEPSLMGGEFGDEDERLITRSDLADPFVQLEKTSIKWLENTQYDASNGVGDEGEFGESPVTSSPSIAAWSSDRKPNQDDGGGD